MCSWMVALPCQEWIASAHNCAYREARDAPEYQPTNYAETCDRRRKVDVLFATLQPRIVLKRWRSHLAQGRHVPVAEPQSE